MIIRLLLPALIMFFTITDAFATVVDEGFGHHLIDAADSGRIHEVTSAISGGTSPNQKGFLNTTPLMRAAYRGHLKIVELLLKSGADPYAKDEGGATALHYAVRAGNEAVINTLVSAGADVMAKDHLGFSPAARAKMMDKPDLIPLSEAENIEIPTPEPVQIHTIKIKKSKPKQIEPQEEETGLVVGEAAIIDLEIEQKPLEKHTESLQDKVKKQLFSIKILHIESLDEVLEIWNTLIDSDAFSKTIVSAESESGSDLFALSVGHFPTLKDAHHACLAYKASPHTCTVAKQD